MEREAEAAERRKAKEEQREAEAKARRNKDRHPERTPGWPRSYFAGSTCMDKTHWCVSLCVWFKWFVAAMHPLSHPTCMMHDSFAATHNPQPPHTATRP